MSSVKGMFGKNTQKFLDYINEHWDSHSILDEKSLYELCEHMGWIYDVKLYKNVKEVVIRMPPYNDLIIHLRSTKDYEKMIENRGKGGSISQKKAWCFDCSSFMHGLAGLIGYSTWKMGMGSGYHDNIEHIVEYNKDEVTV